MHGQTYHTSNYANYRSHSYLISSNHSFSVVIGQTAIKPKFDGHSRLCKGKLGVKMYKLIMRK